MNETDFVLTYKKEGQTPLEALELLRHEKGIGSHIPMTYAGRLDPLAEGLLLILIGDECKKKEAYLGLDKEYEIEVLLRIGSDTGDILGIVDADFGTQVNEDELTEKIKLLIGKRSEKYPLYSSKTVNGKPLFHYSRMGTVNDIEIPKKDIEIYSIEYVSTENVSLYELIGKARKRIESVVGDFRQAEINHSWEKLLKLDNNMTQLITLKVKSSSGSYMRTLAEKLGEVLGVKALAWRIRRTKIGEYSLKTKTV